jgi:hypothetical protein
MSGQGEQINNHKNQINVSSFNNKLANNPQIPGVHPIILWGQYYSRQPSFLDFYILVARKMGLFIRS